VMDIVERLRKRAATWVSVGWGNNDIFDEAADEIERLREAAKDRPKDRPNESADEILRLREWIRHIGYYVSRNEIDPTSTEKYLQKVCASALKEGE